MEFQQSAVVETAPLQEELMLFHPQTNKFCVLNRTTSFVWSCLTNPHAAEQLAEALCSNFEGVTLTDALQDVQGILREMLSLELVITCRANQEKRKAHGKPES